MWEELRVFGVGALKSGWGRLAFLPPEVPFFVINDAPTIYLQGLSHWPWQVDEYQGLGALR
jgi:hypothetical protein